MIVDLKKIAKNLTKDENDHLFEYVLFSRSYTQEDVDAIEAVAKTIKKEWLTSEQIEALTSTLDALNVSSVSSGEPLSKRMDKPWIIVYQLRPYFLEDFCMRFWEGEFSLNDIWEISLVNDKVSLNNEEISFLDFFRSPLVGDNGIQHDSLSDFTRQMILRSHPFINPYDRNPLDDLFIEKICFKLCLDRNEVQRLWMEDKVEDPDHPYQSSEVYRKAFTDYYYKKPIVSEIASSYVAKEAADFAYDVWLDDRMSRFMDLLSKDLKEEYIKQEELCKRKRGLISRLFDIFGIKK